MSRRRAGAHKGDFGHVLVLAGARRFSGAALLCATAALRSGAGLVTLGLPRELQAPLLRVKPPEVMTLPLPQTAAGGISLSAAALVLRHGRQMSAVVLGPGLGQDPSTARFVRVVLRTLPLPCVVDADALNACAKDDRALRERAKKGWTTILTPHPGEMARVTGRPVATVQAQRKSIARTFSNHYNCIIVLKGHRTVVTAPGGRTYVNTTGNPGMATAGSGDVLAGMIAAFLGQGLAPFDAAKYAVYVHGMAGDIAARERTQISMIASDILACIPQAFKRCL